MDNRSARLFYLCVLTLALSSCGGGGNSARSGSQDVALSNLSVATWHYDNARTGATLNESSLTPANVNSGTFGKVFILPVDGAVIGQPLYLGSVPVAGKGAHNVLYVATLHDSVYAFDADGTSSSPLWTKSLLGSGETTVPMSVQGCQNVTQWNEVGVVSTPVIDTASGTIYVVAKSLSNGSSVFRLHALDVSSGEEKLNGPVQISASVSVAGLSSTFSALAELNRPALLLTNGHVYLGFGSNGCNAFNPHGWVLSYNASTLAQEGAFATTPGTNLGSIWQKGGGLSSDAAYNVYAEAAEGISMPGTSFADSIIKLTQSGTQLSASDWFTPYNQDFLRANDLDLNTSVLVLPDQPGPFPHLAMGSGKEGTMYLLNRDNMGQYCPTCSIGDVQIVQELAVAAPYTGSLVYWNSMVYTTGAGSPISAWSINNGLLSPSPVAQTAPVGGGHSPVVTSNGTSNGVLWQLNGTALTAFDASSLASLYSSSQTNGRDTLPALPHFAQLIAVNGKVYVSTNDGVIAFGLLQH